MTQEIALIEDITEDKAPAIYGHARLQGFYDRVKAEVTAEVPDVTTEKGRKRIASLSGKVSSSKTAVEKPGREYLKRLKDLPKTIESELREFVRDMDALRDATRKPLTDWEEEQARIEAQRIAEEAAKALAEKVEADHELALFMNAEHDRIAAEKAKAAEQARIEYEARIAADAAELASAALLARQAQIEREHQAEIEKAKREKAEQEAAALRQQQEHAAALAKAEQDRKDALAKAEADKQRAIEAEQQRQRDEQARIAAEEEARARNKAHAKKINNEILADMVAAGCSEECAKSIIAAIVKGNVRHTQINY